MKTLRSTLILAALLIPAALPLQAQDVPVTEAVPGRTTEQDPAGEPSEQPTGDLRLNFRNARLDQVLDYLSEAAGFTIIVETQVEGTIDAWSNHPVSVQEALDILDSALARNGYAAIRDGRKLKIVSKDKAVSENIPVVQSSDWETIPRSDAVATYVVPVRYIGATELVNTLAPFKNESMEMIANADSNSLLITDSQSNIRRVVRIASLLDSSVSSVSSLRIIPLRHADAVELAETLTSLYSQQNRNSRGTTGTRGGFQFPGGFGGRRGN